MILKKDNNKKLSVMIVNYKSERYLARCLHSLYHSAGQELAMEVIIINNYPQETLQEIRTAFPETQIIVNSKNIGFGRGHNIGARAASGDLLFFLNPDTEILDGSLRDVLAEFERDASLGAVGGCLLTENDRVQNWSVGTKITLWDLIKNNLGVLSDRSIWKKNEKMEVDWVSGTSLFVPRELFLAEGGFDDNIFMYFEDVDLCARLKSKGKRIIYFPQLRIRHKCGGSYSGENRANQNNDYYDSLLYYFKKHRSRGEFLVVKVLRKLFFT